MRFHRILPAATLLLLTAAACTSDSSPVAGATDTPSGSAVPTTSSPGPTESESPSSASPTPAPVIEDGRHFVFVKKTKGTSVTFDLAEFYSGEEANQIAEERGDEVPVPNDVYIVNDNPKLRTVPVSDSAKVKVYDWSKCCDDHTPISFEDFAGYVSDPTNDFHGTLSPYWIRVQGGEIVKIEEQYLP
jgi:hypothetical protein